MVPLSGFRVFKLLKTMFQLLNWNLNFLVTLTKEQSHSLSSTQSTPSFKCHFIRLTLLLKWIQRQRDSLKWGMRQNNSSSFDAQYLQVHKVTRHMAYSDIDWRQKTWKKPELAMLLFVTMTTVVVYSPQLKREQAQRTTERRLHPLWEFTDLTWQLNTCCACEHKKNCHWASTRTHILQAIFLFYIHK